MIGIGHEPFDPADPFDDATETLRTSIAYVVVKHIESNLSFQKLSVPDQFKSLFCAMQVATAGVLGSQTPSRDELMTQMARFIPTAFAMADNIIENGRAAEAKLGEAGGRAQ
jgi:hypothetical protein